MAETITQRLGFDTSDAVSNILAMNKALGGLNTKIRAFNKAVDSSAGGTKIAAGLEKTGTAASQAAKKVGKATKSLEDGGKKGADGVNKITFAWTGLAKALAARTAVQAITNLIGSIVDASRAAEDFEMAIARISNIAKGPGSSIRELEATVSELAVSLGRTQEEVSTAAFEALQNDLGTTTETMELLRGAANDLALVTGGTLTQSVNSLTSILKAYDLPASSAAEVTDQLFAAIDVGRISLAELENSLGKITPLAAQLNIDFGNVAAAMAAITQSGTSASVANTQLRSIFQKLIRPTKSLQAAFNKLGVTTFNELIDRSDGLQDALQKIADALGNDSRAIAEAFGRLRGQLGVFNLLANEGKIFKSTMEAVATSAGSAAEGARKIDGTNARKAQKAYAKFQETMRQLGKDVMVLKTAFFSTFNYVINSGEAAKTAIIGIGSAITAAIAAVKIFGVTLTTALGPAALIGIATVAVVELVKAVDRVTTSWRDVGEEFKAINDKMLEIENRKLDASLRRQADESKEQAKNMVKILDSLIGDMDKAYARLANKTKAREDQMIEAANASIDAFISGSKSLVSGIEEVISGVDERIQGIFKNYKQTVQNIKDLKFERSLEGLNEAEIATKRLAEASKAVKEAREAASKVDLRPGSEKAAIDAINAARKKQQEAVQAARQTGDKQTIKKALDAQISAEEKFRDYQKGIIDRISKYKQSLNMKEFEQQRALLMELERIAAEMKGPEGKGPRPDSEAYKDLVKEFQGGLSRIKPEFFDKFGKSQELQNLIRKFGSDLARLELRFPTAQQALQKELDGKVFEAAVKFNMKDTGNAALDKALSEAKKIENPAESIRQQVSATSEFIDSQNAAGIAATKAANTAATAYDNLGVSLAALKIESGGKNAITAVFSDPGQLAAGAAFFQKLQQLAADSKSATTESAAALRAQTEKIEAVAKARAADGTITSEQLKIILDATIEARRLLDATLEEKKAESIIDPDALQTAREGLELLSEQAAAVELGLDPTKMKDLAGYTSSAASESQILKDGIVSSSESSGALSTNSNSTQVALGGAATNARNLANELERAATAQSKIGASKYFGGLVSSYRASGGPTRGLDTNLTATSPGEFITNARSARMFAAELQAMNAGQSPQFRDKGGPVTNNYGNTIGDISVTVEGGSSSANTARNIGNALDRELRFGTTRLRR